MNETDATHPTLVDDEPGDTHQWTPPVHPAWLHGPDITGWWPHSRDDWKALTRWTLRTVGALTWVACLWWARLTIAWSWRGIGRGLHGTGRWIHRSREREAQEDIEIAARRTTDKNVLDRLGRAYARNQANIEAGPWPRLGVATAVTLGVAATGIAVETFQPGWVPWIILVVILVVIHAAGIAGRPDNPTPISPPQMIAGPARTDMPQLMAALHAEKQCRTPDGRDVRTVQEWTRDRAGSRVATVDLPGQARAALTKAGGLAARLGVGEDMLMLETDRAHAGRLTIRTLTAPPFSPGMRAPRPPLLRAGTVSAWQPIPGHDPLARAVRIDQAAETPGGVVAGMSGSGKSVLGTGILGWCALDPACRLWLVDGGADTRPWQPLAERHVGADHEAVVELLRDLQTEMDRRIALLPDLTRPDGSGTGVTKITAEVAATNPGRGLDLIVCWIDEAGLYTTGPKAAEIATLLQDLSGRLRKAGGRIWLATTEIDKDTLPKPITRNLGWRVALRCQSGTQSRMITGLEASDGWDASRIDQATPGVAYLIGPGVRTMLRSWEYTPAEVDLIAEEARRRREEAGTLPRLVEGAASTESSRAGTVPPAGENRGASRALIPAQRSNETRGGDLIGSRIRDVAGDVPAIHLARLYPLLRAGWPDVYGAMDDGAIGDSVRGAGIPTQPVKDRMSGIRGTRQGVRLQAIR